MVVFRTNHYMGNGGNGTCANIEDEGKIFKMDFTKLLYVQSSIIDIAILVPINKHM